MWFLIILLMISKVYAIDPSSDSELRMVLDDVSMGLQTVKPPYKIGGSPNMMNVFIDNGQIEKIKGFDIIGSSNTLNSGNGITGGFPFTTEDGKKSFLVTDSSSVLETSDYQTFTFVSSGLTPTVVIRCMQVRNKMWCYNGNDSTFNWDRTTKQILNGVGGTPNVPKFKYGAYWQNRVFGGNVSDNCSALYWTDIKSTNGAQIAPDNFLAWPAGNSLFINQGDGECITGIWVNNGQLRIGKERSKFTLFGTDTSSFRERKDDPQIGLNSNDSLVILDGQEYSVGLDGFYQNENRITDEISDQLTTIQRDTIRTVSNLWEIQSDFAKGNFLAGSTATNAGLLTVVNQDTMVIINNLDTSESGSSITFTTAFNKYITTFTSADMGFSFNPNLRAFIGASNIYYGSDNLQIIGHKDVSCGNTSRDVTIRNLKTGKSITRSEGTNYGNAMSPENITISLTNSQVLFDGQDINLSSFSLTIDQDPAGAGCKFYVKFPTNAAKVVLTLATTGQFISEVSTLTSVTAWGGFNSISNSNGGAVNFYFRTSTSAVNIATKTWAQISPGTIISEPTINNYIQWASTIASVSTITLTNIDNVTIGHIEGSGAINRPFANYWNNRLWIGVSTETTGKYPRIYVKSKITNQNPSAWMPVHGINVRSFWRDGSSTFYGGSASTGVFYRLDYGTSFDGSAIPAFYETPDVYLGNIFTEKSIQEYQVFANRESGNNLTIYSYENGIPRSTYTVSLNGSGRAIKTINNVNDNGHYFKWRFENNQLDKGLNITNFGVLSTPTAIRKIKND